MSTTGGEEENSAGTCASELIDEMETNAPPIVNDSTKQRDSLTKPTSAAVARLPLVYENAGFVNDRGQQCGGGGGSGERPSESAARRISLTNLPSIEVAPAKQPPAPQTLTLPSAKQWSKQQGAISFLVGRSATVPITLASGDSFLAQASSSVAAFIAVKTETACTFFLQVVFPFLIAGAGMVGAGVVLDTVQHWRLYTTVPETFVLVPTLLGLKGNLEMTLASRLSTLANLGLLNTREQQLTTWYSNLALEQLQAILISFLAALTAIGINAVKEQQFSIDEATMLSAASITTASLASMVLGTTMNLVVLSSRRFDINPDNVTTPIAASLGDLITMITLTLFGTLYLSLRDSAPWANAIIIGGFFAITPLWFWLAARNPSTRKVLKSGWWPIICAMIITIGGGFVLEAAVKRYPGLAVFQPVINGVGGNLVAVQASRLATFLHRTEVFGNKLSTGTPLRYLSVCRAFFSLDVDSRTARVLLLMAIPGHLIFFFVIFFVKGDIVLTLAFVLAYFAVVVIQVSLLLYICQWLVRLFWQYGIDPDNSSIPLLTALGDLFGTCLLALAFIVLVSLGGYTDSSSFTDVMTVNISSTVATQRLLASDQ